MKFIEFNWIIILCIFATYGLGLLFAYTNKHLYEGFCFVFASVTTGILLILVQIFFNVIFVDGNIQIGYVVAFILLALASIQYVFIVYKSFRELKKGNLTTYFYNKIKDNEELLKLIKDSVSK